LPAASAESLSDPDYAPLPDEAMEVAGMTNDEIDLPNAADLLA
jgi:hypothetical protein